MEREGKVMKGLERKEKGKKKKKKKKKKKVIPHTHKCIIGR